MGKNFSWAFWLESWTWQYILTNFGESVDKIRNQVISTYGRHVAWASNSKEQGIRFIPYLSFLETNKFHFIAAVIYLTNTRPPDCAFPLILNIPKSAGYLAPPDQISGTAGYPANAQIRPDISGTPDIRHIPNIYRYLWTWCLSISWKRNYILFFNKICSGQRWIYGKKREYVLSSSTRLDCEVISTGIWFGIDSKSHWVR